jgi:hypothetical protein
VVILDEWTSGRQTDKRTRQMDDLVYNPPPLDASREHHDEDRPDAVHPRLAALESMTAVSLPSWGDHKSLRSSASVGAPSEISYLMFTEPAETE